MPEQDDKRIRALFAQLRRDDVAQAPSFVSTWEAALRRREETRSVWSWLKPAMARVAAAAVLVLAATLWLWPGAGSPPQDALVNGGDSGILDWTAPTASLLDPEGSDPAPVGIEEAAEMTQYGAWSLPSDTLMAQAEDLFGQELEL